MGETTLRIEPYLGNKTVEGINVTRVTSKSRHEIITTALKWDKPSNLGVSSQRILRGLFRTYLRRAPSLYFFLFFLVFFLRGGGLAKDASEVLTAVRWDWQRNGNCDLTLASDLKWRPSVGVGGLHLLIGIFAPKATPTPPHPTPTQPSHTPTRPGSESADSCVTLPGRIKAPVLPLVCFIVSESN